MIEGRGLKEPKHGLGKLIAYAIQIVILLIFNIISLLLIYLYVYF